MKIPTVSDLLHLARLERPLICERAARRRAWIFAAAALLAALAMIFLGGVLGSGAAP